MQNVRIPSRSEFYPMRRQNGCGSDEVLIKADVGARAPVEAGRKHEI